MLRNGLIYLSVATIALLPACGGDDDPVPSDTMTSSDGGSGGTSTSSSASGGSTSATSGGGSSTTGEAGSGNDALDPDTAEEAMIDRFSEDAGTLMVRDADNGLPEAGEAIDYDQGPFITTGLGPDGQVVQYYNFDVQPMAPAPIYALFYEDDTPVPDQLNIVDVVPGDAGYSDFWHVNKVTVPDDYVANSVTSVSELMATDYAMETLDVLVNCPMVPEGSTADLRMGGGDSGLIRGWYNDMVVYYFSFEEAPLMVTSTGQVPVSPIYVAFNLNPEEDGGGPPSGFVTEDASDQTHNVVETLPGDDDYSPLWFVNIYDNADFDSVSDLASAQDANILNEGAANVNCPIVSVEE
jgi:hypothetical protein